MEGQQQQPLRKPTNDKHMNVFQQRKKLQKWREGGDLAVADDDEERELRGGLRGLGANQPILLYLSLCKMHCWPTKLQHSGEKNL